MKKIKRPNTIKMKRLLMHFIECNVNDRKTLRELQDDARRVIYFEEALKPGQLSTSAPVKATKVARKVVKGKAKRPQRAR